MSSRWSPCLMMHGSGHMLTARALSQGAHDHLDLGQRLQMQAVAWMPSRWGHVLVHQYHLGPYHLAWATPSGPLAASAASPMPASSSNARSIPSLIGLPLAAAVIQSAAGNGTLTHLSGMRFRSASPDPPVGGGHVEPVLHHLLANSVPTRGHGDGEVAAGHGDGGLLGDQEHPGQPLRLLFDLVTPDAAAVRAERRDGFVEQETVGALVGDVAGLAGGSVYVVVHD